MMDLHSQNECHRENTYDKRHFSIVNAAEYDKENHPIQTIQNSPSAQIDENIVNANSSVNESGYMSCCYVSSENLYPTPNTRRNSDVFTEVTNIPERPQSTRSIQQNIHSTSHCQNEVSSNLSDSEEVSSSLDEPTTANETEAAIASILSRTRNAKPTNHFDASSILMSHMYNASDPQNKIHTNDNGNLFQTEHSLIEPNSSKRNPTIKPENCADLQVQNNENNESAQYCQINTPPEPTDSLAVGNVQTNNNNTVPAIPLPPLFSSQGYVYEQNNPFLPKPTNISTCHSAPPNAACNTSDLDCGNSHLGTNSAWIKSQGSTISSKLEGEIFPFTLGDANIMITTPTNADITNQQVRDTARYWPWPNRLWAEGTSERVISFQNDGTTNLTFWGGSQLNQKDISGRVMPEFFPGIRLAPGACDNQMNALMMPQNNAAFVQPFRPTNENLSAFQAVSSTLSQHQSAILNRGLECGDYQNHGSNLSFNTDNILKDTSGEDSHSVEHAKMKSKKKESSKIKPSADARSSLSSGFVVTEPRWPSFDDGVQDDETRNQSSTWINNDEVTSTPNQETDSEHSKKWRLKRARNAHRPLARKPGSHRLSRNRPLNDTALSLMENWYVQHIDNPYPTNAEKHELAILGQITTTQVSSWFANRRTRSCNTRPKKNRQKLYDQLFQFAVEMETHTQGLVRATDVEGRLKKIIQEYLS